MACRIAPSQDYQPETPEEAAFFQKLLDRQKEPEEPTYMYDIAITTPDDFMRQTIANIFKNVYDDTYYCYNSVVGGITEPPAPAGANLPRTDQEKMAHETPSELLDHYHRINDEAKIKEQLQNVDKPVINLKIVQEMKENPPEVQLNENNAQQLSLHKSANMSDYDHSSKLETSSRKKKSSKKSSKKGTPSNISKTTEDNSSGDASRDSSIKEEHKPEEDTNKSKSSEQEHAEDKNDDDVVGPRGRPRTFALMQVSSNVEIVQVEQQVNVDNIAKTDVQPAAMAPASSVVIPTEQVIADNQPLQEEKKKSKKPKKAKAQKSQKQEKAGMDQLLLSQDPVQAQDQAKEEAPEVELPPKQEQLPNPQQQQSALTEIQEQRQKVVQEVTPPQEEQVPEKVNIQQELQKLQGQLTHEELEQQRMILQLRNTDTYMQQKKQYFESKLNKKQVISISPLSNTKVMIQKVGPMLVGSIDNNILFSVPLKLENFKFDDSTYTIQFGENYKTTFKKKQYQANKKIIEKQCAIVEQDDSIKTKQRNIIYNDDYNSLVLCQENGKYEEVLSLADSKQEEITDGLFMIKQLTGESIAILKSSQ